MSSTKRTPLNKERVLRAAVAIADEGGLEAVSMRRVAKELGVEAMSLYNHVSNKDEILDGLVEAVAGEIDIPADDVDWKTAVRTIALSAHATLRRHRWAQSLWMARGGPGPARLSYAEALLRAFRGGGFSKDLTYDAFHIFEALILGVTAQHLSVPGEGADLAGLAEGFLGRLPADEYPYLIEHVKQHLDPSPSDHSGFEFAIDLLLDGLERARDGS
ncbi:MAG: TetR/AcrR family transcriptional regulator [Gaiellaceae bacterium]